MGIMITNALTNSNVAPGVAARSPGDYHRAIEDRWQA
jgi:hypothetical protein